MPSGMVNCIVSIASISFAYEHAQYYRCVLKYIHNYNNEAFVGEVVLKHR